MVLGCQSNLEIFDTTLFPPSLLVFYSTQWFEAEKLEKGEGGRFNVKFWSTRDCFYSANEATIQIQEIEQGTKSLWS